MYGQSKAMAIFESSTNVFVGMVVAFCLSQAAAHYETQIQAYIWSDFHWNIGTGSNVLMSVMLTIVSVLRGYTLRRVFNKVHEKALREALKFTKGKSKEKV